MTRHHTVENFQSFDVHDLHPRFIAFARRCPERFSGRFPTEQIAMLGPTKVAVSFALVAFSLMTEGTTTNGESKLPDPINVGVAEKLFRLDCGRSLANDESVWTPGENVGRSIEFSSTC
jgi:hypothetical protein